MKIMQKIDVAFKPVFCCLAVTDFCMLKCKMCEKWKEAMNWDHVPQVEDWKQFLNDFRHLVDKGFDIDFGGGEALSYPGITELIAHAESLGFHTTLATNAYLIDKKMAKRLSEAGLHHISMSLDFTRPEKHDEYRGQKGVYAQVMKAIDNLHIYAPYMRKGLCTVIMDENLDELEKLAMWMHKNHKLDWLYFMSVVQPNNTPYDETWQDEFAYLWPKDKHKAVQVLDRLMALKAEGVNISNMESQLKAFRAYFANPTEFVNKAKCIIGGTSVNVNAYGDIYLCFTNKPIGNIRKDNIIELLNSEKVKNLREELSECKQNCHLLLNCCYIEDDVAVPLVRAERNYAIDMAISDKQKEHLSYQLPKFFKKVIEKIKGKL